eukprot:TRINITY_DN1091_c4_g1_i1.p1 TRINITY_DN1091_c4_g1~~TRINITY_DN1091_c4_g1_i1.p1  ORF type:complete len:134 (+),score=45.43 TRINITY_DN1091_c4_g1_i1:37-438(+)
MELAVNGVSCPSKRPFSTGVKGVKGLKVEKMKQKAAKEKKGKEKKTFSAEECALAAKERVKNFKAKEKKDKERLSALEREAQRKLIAEREETECVRQKRRSEIYALNTLLAHMESKKLQLFEQGLISSADGGV